MFARNSHPRSILRSALILLVVFLLNGCALDAYSPVSNPEFKGPALKTVRANPEAFVDTRVRWGGSIARVENRSDETLVEIVEHPLRRYGRPQTSYQSEGRFVARIPGFLDPAIYDEGRQITVTGTLKGSVQRKIGEHPYEFPLVAADEYSLWEEREPEYTYHPYPYWHYGFGYRHHFFHHGYPYYWYW